MGLLDDAIRDHLELKRKRGADPAEVARQEREVLTPVRGAAHPADEAPELAADLEPEPRAEPEPDDGFDPGPALDAGPEFDAEPEPEPAYEPRGAVRMPEVEPEPEPPATPPPPAAPEPVSQPTQQYSVDDLEDLRRDADPPPAEDVVPADEDPPGEDELAETPDFLQEAPEHDRLWFEQRPPRDFDF